MKQYSCKESRLTITNKLIEYDNWDYTTISIRQEYLYEQSKDIWN